MIATRSRESAFKQALRALEPGVDVQIDGPFGQFRLRRDVTTHVLIAGGIGITPFRSIIVQALAESSGDKIVLFHANHDIADAPFYQEMLDLSSRGLGFQYVPALTRPSEGWTGERGHVDASMLGRYLDATDSMYYVAGPPAMVLATKAVLASSGIAPERIISEDFEGYEESPAKSPQAPKDSIDESEIPHANRRLLMASEVGSVEDVPAGRVVAFEVDGQAIAVANVDGALFAFDDHCTHRGCSLAEGTLDGTSVTCPCHSSVFQVTDGAVIAGPAVKPLPTYAVEIVDGKIAVSPSGTSALDAGQAASPTRMAASEPAEPAGGGQPAPEAGTGASGHERVHNALASVPLFSDLDNESIERLEAFAFRKTFPAGEIIVEEGHTGNGLYIVLSGSVDVIKGLRGPNPQKVAVLRAGEPFGEMALLGDWKRSASVQAVDEVECLGLDRWAFLTHLKNEPSLAIRMLQMLADRLVQTDSRLAE